MQHHLNNIQRNIFLQPNNDFLDIYQHQYYRQEQLRAMQSSTSEMKLKMEDNLKVKEEESKELRDRIRY